MNTETLKRANIPEKHWNYCYISTEGIIWTPATNESGEILQTGKEVYDDYITRKKISESKRNVYTE